jgi:hypothetical protein
MQQVHCVDDQRNVGRVLAFGIGELLVRIDGVLLQDIRSRLELWSGKIPVDAANTGLAELRHFLEQSGRDLRRGVVRIDQHGEAGQALLFGIHHGTFDSAGGRCILA